MNLRLRHILFALVFAPLALAAEPAVADVHPGAAGHADSRRTHRTTTSASADRERFERLCAQVAAAYDTSRGGFVGKNGVPAEGAVELALALGREGASVEWKERAFATIDWTHSLLDTTSGGFMTRAPKSSADGAALEMRTDVNARRLATLVEAWQATGQGSYRRDAARVAGFMDRVLLDGRGGFVAAQIGDRSLDPRANGIAIHAWLTWGAANADAGVRDFVLRSIDRVWETCFDPAGVLLRHGDFGEVAMPPQLADQVEMGRALVLASWLCGRPQDLERARGLGHVVLLKFQERSRGGFMTQAKPKKDGMIKRAGRDAEENARAALFLAELASATGDDAFRDAARRTWTAFDHEQEKAGLAAADWALAVRAVIAPDPHTPPAWRAQPSATVVTPRVIRFRTGRR